MSGTGNENEVPNHRRSTRARKQREANPCEFLDEEEDAASAAGSPAPSSDSSSTTVSNNPSRETRLARPTVHRRCHWRQKRNAAEFSYVDGANKIFRRRYWWGDTSGLNYYYAGTFVKAENALVEDQDTRAVSLEVTNFGSEVKLTQVPYREYRVLSHLIILSVAHSQCIRRGPVAALRVLRQKYSAAFRYGGEKRLLLPSR